MDPRPIARTHEAEALSPVDSPNHNGESRLHRRLEALTGVILIGLLVLAPWLLGGWPAWSAWSLNAGGCVLGLLGIAQCLERRRTGYRPSRWGGYGTNGVSRAMAALTLALLAWTLISACNARSTVDPVTLQIIPRPGFIAWLPHSYDRPATWFAFGSYLGLAGTFWSARDWVTIRSHREGRAIPRTAGVPDRVRWLLVAMSWNGALVAVVGIVSTWLNPDRILGLFPHPTRSGNFFGPFWYRNTGAHFLNLLFPVAFALWLAWHARHEGGRATRGFRERVLGTSLLIATGLMAAGPFIGKSRGGSLIAVGLLAGCVGLALAGLEGRPGRKIAAILVLGVMAGGAIALAWSPLKERFVRGFVVFPTERPGPWREFTLRCVFEAPASWRESMVAVAGLSDTRVALGDTPGSVSINLRREGRLEIQYAGPDGGTELKLIATNRALATPHRTVEVTLTQDDGGPRVYLDGELLTPSIASRRNATGWPAGRASTYLWVGRAFGGSYVYREPIHTVTVLDRSVTEAELTGILRGAGGGADAWSERDDLWAALVPPPVLHLHPQAFSPKTWFSEGLSGRVELQRQVRRMMADYPAWCGAGPGTFGGLYRATIHDPWATDAWYAHDDHLEARFTMGLVGLAMVYALLGLVVSGGGWRTHGSVPAALRYGLIGGLAGALVHARFDWVFQTPAVLLTAVVLAAVLSVTRTADGDVPAEGGRSLR